MECVGKPLSRAETAQVPREGREGMSGWEGRGVFASVPMKDSIQSEWGPRWADGTSFLNEVMT